MNKSKTFDTIARAGCVCCWRDRELPLTESIHKFDPNPGDIHHLLDGGRRRGDAFVICLCPWHHRGVVPQAWMKSFSVQRLLGPSMALNKKAFRDRYGSDDSLLAYQRELLEVLASIESGATSA